MFGAIIGDIVGSRYEHNNIKTKDFEFFGLNCRFTDDSVLTIATMEKYIEGISFEDAYRKYYRLYPNVGYGSNFRKWGESNKQGPYNSYGNGSAMRVSPVAWLYDDLESVLKGAKESAEVTHNHPEGIKGAQATAAAIFLARTNKSNDYIKKYIEEKFNYNLNESLDSIREEYAFDASCQGSVPQAIIAFLEAKDYEDAVRNAVSIGGDSDTIACITGAIAEAKFGIRKEIIEEGVEFLTEDLKTVIRKFKMLIDNNKAN